MVNHIKALGHILLLIMPLFISAQVNQDYKTAEKSEEKTLFYDDENYGSIKFTYYTY